MLGPVRLRQDDDAARDRRLRAAGRGQRRARRQGRLEAAAVRARRQHGLPGLRALPAHDRAGERRVRAAGEEGARVRSGAGAPARRSRSFGSRATAAASPAQLSGGQRQRVALARAIVNRPQALLLDEPLGALDLKLRQELQIELKRIQQELGITFIYVTHDQEEALTMSDRLAVFNEGRIEQIGAPGRGVRASRERVHRRLRRRLERARAGRPPLHGAAGEDPPARRRARAREPGAVVEEGRIANVVYVGAITRYHVGARRRRRADSA